MKKLLSLLLLLILTLPGPAYAQTATSSANPNPSPATASASVLDKLNALKAEIASKAAVIKQQVDQQIDNKIWFGTINSQTTSQIDLKVDENTKIININEFTLYQTPTKKTATLKDLLDNDFIIALGDIDDKGQLTGKKIIKSTPVVKTKTTVVGKVKSLSGKSLTLTIDDQDQTFSLNNNTVYRSAQAEAKLTDISIGEVVSVVLSKQTAQLVYFVYPPKPTQAPNKTASNSAQLKTATPSATPTKP